MISLKRHAIVAFELASRCGGIDLERAQFLVCEPSARCSLDLGAESLNQFGRALIRIRGMATQAGAITALQRFTRCREEIDILSRRFLCRARRPAENPCRSHTDKEYAFKPRIAIYQRAIHHFRRRKKFHCFHVNKLSARVCRRIDEIRATNSIPHARWIRNVKHPRLTLRASTNWVFGFCSNLSITASGSSSFTTSASIML